MADIRQIKQRTNIVQVIGRYVRLQEKGGKATGICPFHDDHHPSLQVDMARQTFTCFACGAHGDVFSFLQKIENCSFAEAVNKLDTGTVNRCTGQEKRAERKSPPPDPALRHRNEEYLRMLMPYLPPHTELTDTYLAFEVGLSPVWLPPAFKAMSGRIVFPIRDDAGALTGFAGRRPKDEGESLPPKYINSSLAGGYNKSETLYALFRAKDAIQASGEVYLTEGYKDALAMHAAGFVNTVALGGTALTDGQVALLKKYGTEKAFLFADADRAGQDAAGKMERQLHRERIDTLRIPAETHHDPDSLFREMGAQAFAAYVRRTSHPPVLLREKDLLYNETALRETLKDLIRQYRHTADERSREDILHTLYHRLDQYTLLSQTLSRTGVV